MSYSSEVLADSPTAYYRLGETSGTTAVDSSGNGRDTTWSAAPTPVAGLLTGDSDGAQNPNSRSTNLADAAWMHTSAVTVEAWVSYTTVNASAAIVDEYGSGAVGASRWLFYTPSGKFGFLIRDNLGDKLAQASASIATGTVYHIVGVADGSTCKLYVNGTQVASVATGPIATGTAGMVIGKTVFNGAGHIGVIDEVAIYNTALSATRIAAHYAAGTGAATPAAGSASLSLSAAGGAAATSAGSASLNLSASGAGAGAAAGSASLSLSASGALVAPSPAAGAASLTLSATGGASATPSGTAALNLVAAGTALAAGIAAGTATLTITASGSAVMSAGGTAVLTITAAGVASALYETDTGNALNGRTRGAYAVLTVTRPAAVLPPDMSRAQRYDKAIAYPVPAMVDGRPT